MSLNGLYDELEFSIDQFLNQYQEDDNPVPEPSLQIEDSRQFTPALSNIDLETLIFQGHDTANQRDRSNLEAVHVNEFSRQNANLTPLQALFPRHEDIMMQPRPVNRGVPTEYHPSSSNPDQFGLMSSSIGFGASQNIFSEQLVIGTPAEHQFAFQQNTGNIGMCSQIDERITAFGQGLAFPEPRRTLSTALRPFSIPPPPLPSGFFGQSSTDRAPQPPSLLSPPLTDPNVIENQHRSHEMDSNSGSRRSPLKKMKKNTANKDHLVCQTCHKRFPRPHNLRIHQRLHTGEEPYVCPFIDCKRQFKWRSSISAHCASHAKAGDVLRRGAETYRLDLEPNEPALSTTANFSSSPTSVNIIDLQGTPPKRPKHHKVRPVLSPITPLSHPQGLSKFPATRPLPKTSSYNLDSSYSRRRSFLGTSRASLNSGTDKPSAVLSTREWDLISGIVQEMQATQNASVNAQYSQQVLGAGALARFREETASNMFRGDNSS